jgi:hypothetical protein
MPHTVLLNNVDHQHLRVITRRGAAFGDDVMFATTFPAEFRVLQAHYPVVFRKTPDGTGFEPVALLGLAPGQNLFLRADGRWDAPVVPLAIERLPFYIGRDGEGLVVHVDIDSPRLSTSEGEALFLAQGGSTDFLARMNSVLLAIHQGLQGTPAFMAAMRAHDLIEPFTFEATLADGTSCHLSGYYTLHEDRLAALDGEALAQLGRAGHLQAAYMAIASLSQLQALVARLDAAHASHG